MGELADLNVTSYEITCEEDLQKLNLILRKIIEMEKKICDRIDPEIANAYKTHKGLTALKKEELQPFLNVKAKINDALKLWQIKKDAEAKALQDKINADLAKKAEEYKQELLQEAESSNEWDKEVLKEKANEIVPQAVDLSACKEAVTEKQQGHR